MGPRVCFVAPSAYTLGGTATWLDRLVPDLRDMGWRAQVVLTEGDHHDARAYERAHPAIAPALRVRSHTGTPEGRVQALAKLLEAVAPCLVVSVNIPDAVSAVARLKATGKDVRAVMSVHGLEPDLFKDMAFFAPVLDGTICTNRLAHAVAAGVPGVDPRRVRYAPYATPPAQRRATAQEAPHVFTIGVATRFEHFQKRVQDLAPIAGALARRGVAAHWLVAGDGPDRDEVMELARSPSLSVEFLGRLQPHEMSGRFLSRCDVLLNASEWETGPIVVWEAMAHDVAVVSSRYVGSAREAALRHGENCLLFDVGDVECAAGCLTQASSPTLRRELCAAARTLVATRYSPEASAAAWAGALHDLARMPALHGTPPMLTPAGRLDRWLGPTLAERVRRGTARRFLHVEPGGEWPHTYHPTPRDDAAHWAALRDLEAMTQPEDSAG